MQDAQKRRADSLENLPEHVNYLWDVVTEVVVDPVRHLPEELAFLAKVVVEVGQFDTSLLVHIRIIDLGDAVGTDCEGGVAARQ